LDHLGQIPFLDYCSDQSTNHGTEIAQNQFSVPILGIVLV
jgi:hypothetical protein